MLPWNDGVAGHSEARLTDDVFAEVNAYGTRWRARVAMNDLRDSGMYTSIHDAQAAAESLVHHHFDELSTALKMQDQPQELFLCEINRLFLHPDQPYIFRQHPACDQCAAYARSGKP